MFSRTSGERSEQVPPQDAGLPAVAFPSDEASPPEPALDASPTAAGPDAASRAALSDVEFLKQVGRGVASVYSDILGQPMPDRLIALLKRLEEEEDAPKSGNRSHL